MTIQDFLVALRGRWRIIVATLVVVLAATTAVTMQTPRVYESSTRVYLMATSDLTSGNLYNMPASEKETLVEVASSPVVLDTVREQLDLPPGTPIQVSATSSGDTNLLDVSARSDDPVHAQQIATAVPQVLASVARNFAPSLAQSGQSVEAQVVSPAGASGTPVVPDTTTNLLLGALAGLLLGVAFALARHSLDTRVRTPRDLASLSDRPLLSAIPDIASDKAGHRIYLESDPFGPQAEAVRQLRTNMLFVDVTTGGHSFMVTSSVPGEGKTTTTVNLGLALADSGLQVLVIDADLRHPTVAKTLGLEGGVGLTTVLVGAAAAEDVLQQWAGTNLHVLAAGEIPPNPSELLGSGAMRELFGELSARFDFILVDTPPVLPVADSLVVSRLTSGTMMVVSATTTRKRHLAEALRILRTADVEIGGFVLTKTAPQPSVYYSYGTSQRAPGADTRSARHDRSGRRRRGQGKDRSRRTKLVDQQVPHAARVAEERLSRRGNPATAQAAARHTTDAVSRNGTPGPAPSPPPAQDPPPPTTDAVSRNGTPATTQDHLPASLTTEEAGRNGSPAPTSPAPRATGGLSRYDDSVRYHDGADFDRDGDVPTQTPPARRR